MRVLVTGGRDYADEATLFETLWAIHAESKIDWLIHGGATGADTLAGKWADRFYVSKSVYYADWAREGKAAGPLRNARMLEEGKPDLVVAFSGGRGTADMVRRAKNAGVRVTEVSQ